MLGVFSKLFANWHNLIWVCFCIYSSCLFCLFGKFSLNIFVCGNVANPLLGFSCSNRLLIPQLPSNASVSHNVNKYFSSNHLSCRDAKVFLKIDDQGFYYYFRMPSYWKLLKIALYLRWGTVRKWIYREAKWNPEHNWIKSKERTSRTVSTQGTSETVKTIGELADSGLICGSSQVHKRQSTEPTCVSCSVYNSCHLLY